ncbi:hypothetical protein CQW23_35098 [Capsicum baccatum]|uniref:Protein TAR1 n=1 Tax=Capsicum baccatum TaxID=33114 RepID=A0A2G2UX61_CAPBA|nr:hypothetical protein CQW23_35098 [Capsicum baccatum]
MKAACRLRLPHLSIPTAAHGPRHRTTKRGRRGTQGRTIDSPRERNTRGEWRSIKLDNACSTGNRPRARLHCACPATEMAGGRIPLVRTSSELAVQRAGSISSSPPTAYVFGTGTPVPSPQSHSFSRSYGSILLTSLAYFVPSTRGCSPWRPDAVMSTTGHGRHSVLRIFKGRRERTGHHATCGALPAAGPYLRLSRFQGGQAVKQKR